jgi:general secretion pathway protein K
MNTATRASRGAALLLVLWLVLLISGVISVFALDASSEARQAGGQRARLSARLAAEGGIELAAWRMLQDAPQRRLVPDGRRYEYPFDDWQVELRVFDESGKVDINVADPALLEALLREAGTPPARAGALAAAIIDWRDPDDLLMAGGGAEDPQYEAAGLDYGARDLPFVDPDELRLVLGMDEAVYSRLATHVTVHTGNARPDPAYASELVLRAIGFPAAEAAALRMRREAWQPGLPPPVAADGRALAGTGTGTYSVLAIARRDEQVAVPVAAVFRVGISGLTGQPYSLLAWPTDLLLDEAPSP